MRLSYRELATNHRRSVIRCLQSDSTKVKFTAADVTALENHLNELGIPRDAILIAMGNKTIVPLTKFAKRPVAQIQHYSGANAHWNAEDVHHRLSTLVKN